MALSTTEIDQNFSAQQEHGQEVASHFKEFVKSLDEKLPDNLAKRKFLVALQEASNWAHTALADAEQAAKNALHQRAKSGEKPSTDAPSTQTTTTTSTAISDTPPADTTPSEPVQTDETQTTNTGAGETDPAKTEPQDTPPAS